MSKTFQVSQILNLLVPIPKSAVFGQDWLVKSEDTVALILLDGNVNVIKTHFIENIKTLFYTLLKIPCIQSQQSVNFPPDNVIWQVRIHGKNPTVVENRWDVYVLSVDNKGVYIESQTSAGIFYAIQTLSQIVSLSLHYLGSAKIPQVTIRDFADFPNRGLMLDVSRNKVPTLTQLFELVDLLASLKYNQLQLYTEHTFAYRGHEVVWAHSSPLTPHEIRTLDVYCTQRCITLVPNQNRCFLTRHLSLF
jgi:hypothetical protein